MKKRLFSVAAVACAAALCTVLFAACGGGEEPGDQPGVPVTYTIAAEPSEDYTLTPSKTSAQAGEVITVTAESKNADKYITGVTYNGTACEEEEDGYSFTMPAANVTLAAQTGTYAEKLTGDFISFTGFLPDTIAAFENTFDAEAAFEFTFDREIQVEDDEVMLSSSNQSIVPDSALSVSLNETSMGSTGKDGGTLYVAVNDIAPGTAYITMTVKDRTTGRSDTVVKKLTVVEEGTIEVPTMRVTLTFDLSDVWSDLTKKADTLVIFLNDANNIYGAKNDTGFEKTYTMTEVEDPSEITVTMENFAVGHTYSVGVRFMNGEDHYASAKMNSLTNSKGSFDGNWLKLEEAEAVDFGTLTAYSVG